MRLQILCTLPILPVMQSATWRGRMAIFGQYALHNLAYHPIKGETGLTAQVMVRCIAKVADAYKLDKRRKRTFKCENHGIS